MLDFMIISLPRSGSTWAANWLTGDRVYCHHDPLWTMHYDEFDERIPAAAGDRVAGIACTGIWMWPDWVNAHPARKLIVHRDRTEVEESLKRIRFPRLPREARHGLDRITGMHVNHTDLFHDHTARVIWRHLTRGLPFDRDRHDQLRQMKVEPQLDSVERDMALNARLAEELTRSCCTRPPGSSSESATAHRSR